MINRVAVIGSTLPIIGEGSTVVSTINSVDSVDSVDLEEDLEEEEVDLELSFKLR